MNWLTKKICVWQFFPLHLREESWEEFAHVCRLSTGPVFQAGAPDGHGFGILTNCQGVARHKVQGHKVGTQSKHATLHTKYKNNWPPCTPFQRRNQISAKKMTTKETFYFRQLLIFARLSLLYTMSQAHKVVHVSVSPPFVQQAASFLSSHSICYWYFFFKMGNFGTVCMVTQNGLFVPFFLVVKNKGFKGWGKTF